jgi:ribose transport system substrate-binding protein
MKRQFSSIILMGMILFLTACTPREEDGDKLVVAVIPKGTAHVYWQSMHAGSNKAGRELGIDINWIGPEREDDRQQQIALVDNQVINQVDGIVLCPLDDIALKRPVRAASKSGIPVVILDSGLQDAEDYYVSYIATDNFSGGQLAAEKLADLIGHKGRIAMLREGEGAGSTEARAEGFLKAMEAYPEIEVVASDQYGGATKALAQQTSENLLLRFQNAEGALTINGLFCVNESTTYGMLQALRRKRLAGTIKFIGFDSSDPLLVGLESGEINGLVVQDPFRMGYLGVSTLVKHLRGETVNKFTDTGVTFVTAENLGNPEIAELVQPDLDKWLGKQ